MRRKFSRRFCLKLRGGNPTRYFRFSLSLLSRLVPRHSGLFPPRSHQLPVLRVHEKHPKQVGRSELASLSCDKSPVPRSPFPLDAERWNCGCRKNASPWSGKLYRLVENLYRVTVHSLFFIRTKAIYARIRIGTFHSYDNKYPCKFFSSLTTEKKIHIRDNVTFSPLTFRVI